MWLGVFVVGTEVPMAVVAGVEAGTPHISNRYPTGSMAQENESNLNLLVVEN